MSNAAGKPGGRGRIPHKILPKRPLKPIFPKLPGCELQCCYVCDSQLFGTGLPLAQQSTETTNTSLATKIGNLFGNSCMIIVTPRDVICRSCFALFNESDHLEDAFKKIQCLLKALLYKKYNISDTKTDGSSSTALADSASPSVAEVECFEYEYVPTMLNTFKPIIPKPDNAVKKPAEVPKQAYGCNMCDVTFDSPKSIRSHKMKVHLSNWTCHFCNASFVDVGEYTDHTASHLSGASNHHCHLCSDAFSTKEQLIEHVKNAHVQPEAEVTPSEESNDDTKPSIAYNCIMCSMEFQNIELLNQHLQTHDTLTGLEDLGNLDKSDSLPLDVFEGTSESVDLLDINMFDNSESSENRIFCGDCGIQIETMEQMKDHIETNHKLSELTEAAEEAAIIVANEKSSCGLCGDAFDNDDAANAHIQECQGAMTEVKIFACSTCGALAETENDLLAHKSVCGVAGLSEVKHESQDGVDGAINEESEMASDVDVAPPQVTKKTSKRSCQACGSVFPTLNALYQHEKEHPDHLPVIHCPDCDMSFIRQKALNEHRQQSHEVVSCRFCPKTFTNLKQVKAHEARHERSARTRFDCSECGRVFMTPTGLRQHQAVHTGIFSYTCEFCGKGFVSRARAEEHRASHTKESRYTCELCNMNFSFQATYWIHKKWHENPKPYKCEDCGRLFKHTSLLAVHRRKHTGERPYACEHCDQTFTVGNTLKRHLSLHTGVFPYNCTVCKTGFSARHKLASHMSKIHQDDTLIQEQVQNTRKTDYKMIIKDQAPDASVELSDETWILAEEENEGGQYLTLQVEDGERILLTGGMLEDNGDNQLVEIILPVEKEGVAA